MTLKPKTTLLKLPLFFTFLIAALIIYSCRKDNNNSQAQSNSQIDEARAWYENTFPVTNKISGGLQTQGAGKNHDLTQWIKPDWQHPNAYIRNGESVIEMPIDPASKFASSVKLNTKRFNPKYSRSYYLVIHDSTKYNAYILTIVADSSYVGNDLSKLGHNTYRKHDADFTGSVLYFTPKGDYLGGYGYNNGKLMEPGTPEVKAGSQQINSVHTDDLKDNYMKQECTDWYIVYYKDGEYWYDEYLTTTCTMVDDGSGQGGGGSGPPPPPPPCPAGSHPGPPVIRPCIPPAVASVDNGNKVAVNYVPPPPPPGDDGLPPPPSQSCSVDPPREPCPVEEDPCAQAKKLVQDAAFKSKMNDLKSKVTLSYETGYTIDASGSYKAVQGPAGQAFISLSPTTPLSGYIHTHYTGTLPTFSGTDVKAIYDLQQKNKIANISTFTAGVVTASGTTYIMKVNDPAKFATFAAGNLNNDANFKQFELYYSNKEITYEVTGKDKVTAHEMALLSALQDSGLTILKGNNTFSSWDTYTLKETNGINDSIVIINCK
ncbi:hypothetical protein ACFQZX_15330 [Mucilaginibacter litoreus]|uniref:Uncharacterized protein n=1 Tax=Mucilaginibacter litoreus TaxID=1048221 RepID=A0ABW3AVN4_9SPHI